MNRRRSSNSLKRPRASQTWLIIAAALAALMSSFAIGNPAVAQVKPSEGNALQADPRAKQIKVTGERWRITAVPEGSWCPSGLTVLEKGKALTFGESSFEVKGSTLAVSGVFKVLEKIGAPKAYTPSVFFKKDEKKPPTPKQVLSEKQLQEGIDVEVCGADGVGLGVVRCQTDWRGISCGPVSGWRFALEDDARILVDADLDGLATYTDRVLYEGHPYWMPWHQVTCGPKYQYYDLSVDPEALVTGSYVPLGDLGDEADVAKEWNAQRLAAGVPPGVFDPALTPACQKHAEYLKLNKLAAHEEDPALPGYTKEGALAGMSSSITFNGKNGVVDRLLGTLYHRMTTIHPGYSTLAVGGNDYAYLLGIAGLQTGIKSALVSERRRMKYPLVHPAPGGVVRWTTLVPETPACIIYSDSKPVGFPVMVLLPEYFVKKDFGPPTKVRGFLYHVQSGDSSDKRGKEVKVHLSYPGHQTPEDHPDNFGLVALTPYSPLEAGRYEVECQFTYKGTDFKLQWRFEVDPTKK
ncbi:hypothetical protein PLCT2_01220 [Planctomycetaceae bacterium]|nr:hypothetical protein PLCT2_01220 [Planctomycetaceae bacterium]